MATSASGQQTILSTGGMQPEYMTLDKAKNLYVVVTAPAGVLKFPYSNGSYVDCGSGPAPNSLTVAPRPLVCF